MLSRTHLPAACAQITFFPQPHLDFLNVNLLTSNLLPSRVAPPIQLSDHQQSLYHPLSAAVLIDSISHRSQAGSFRRIDVNEKHLQLISFLKQHRHHGQVRLLHHCVQNIQVKSCRCDSILTMFIVSPSKRCEPSWTRYVFREEKIPSL